MDDLIKTFESVTSILRWRQDAYHKLSLVRGISEIDMDTLERIVEDYIKITDILRKHACVADRELIDAKYKGYLPVVLEKVLGNFARSCPCACHSLASWLRPCDKCEYLHVPEAA